MTWLETEDFKQKLGTMADSDKGCANCAFNDRPNCCRDLAGFSLDCIESIERRYARSISADFIKNFDKVAYDATNEREAVDHPDHYQSSGYECIDVMAEIYGKEEVMTFCKLNAFKYLWRAGKKGSLDEDIKKAEWYLSKYRDLKETV